MKVGDIREWIKDMDDETEIVEVEAGYCDEVNVSGVLGLREDGTPLLTYVVTDLHSGDDDDDYYEDDCDDDEVWDDDDVISLA